MSKRDSIVYELSKVGVVILFVYYFLILCVGSWGVIEIICTLGEVANQEELLLRIFLSSLSVSGMLCSLQYIKRLYKACITNRITPKTTFWGSLGNLAYFIFRPLFAFVFVIVMICVVLSGGFILTGNLDYVLNEKCLYMCVIFSSFIGYSVGDLLDKFDDISREKINEMK